MTRAPILTLILLAFALSGCGNKGPLVHPPAEEAPSEAPTPAQSDAGAEADPPPADEADDVLPAEPAPLPPTDAAEDDPPGDG